MYAQDIIGELLYIGIVAEKGRCYGQMWKRGYKNVLKTHLSKLYKLQKCLQMDNSKQIIVTINDFMLTCNEIKEIGRFYHFVNESIDRVCFGTNIPKVDMLMDDLFEELMREMNKIFLNKKRIYSLLNVMHNLPRVYLGEHKQTLCQYEHMEISEQLALEYAYANMEDEMKKKYYSIVFHMSNEYNSEE